MKFKKTLILSVLLIFICCIGAACASDNDAHLEEVSDDSSLESIDIDDTTLEVNNVEEQVLGTTNTVSDWSSLSENANDTAQDHTINLNDPITIEDNDIEFGNNAVIIGNAKSNNELLGASPEDTLKWDETHEFYVNSSKETSGDGSSWDNALNTLDGFGMYVVMELWYDETGDYNTIYLADGEYNIADVIGYAKFVGMGDNVIIKDVNILSNQDPTYVSEASATFENLIFEGFTALDDYDCTFINCTFKNISIDLYKNRENKELIKEIPMDDGSTTYEFAPPIFSAEFKNCNFTDITGNYVIDSHKYNLLKINNCNFNNCNVENIIVTNANLTKDDGSHDGVIISNINVSSSTYNAVLKAKKDTNYSVENIEGLNITSVEDGDYIYVNATDIKAEEPSTNTTNTSTTNTTSKTSSKTTTTTTKKVTKKATKITAKAKTFKVKKAKKYTITLKSGKTAVKKVWVTLKIKGKKVIKVKTNSKGKATFNLKKLTKKGKYTATIKFAGNKNYKATTKKVKITVKK